MLFLLLNIDIILTILFFGGSILECWLRPMIVSKCISFAFFALRVCVACALIWMYAMKEIIHSTFKPSLVSPTVVILDIFR